MTDRSKHITEDPFRAFFSGMETRIIAAVEEYCQRAYMRQVFDIRDLGIEPLRAYTAKEVARLLGTDRVESVYEIPKDELPRVRRIGTSVGYLGINVLCYMHGLPPVDVAGAIEQYRRHLLSDQRPSVRPLHTDSQDKTRIL